MWGRATLAMEVSSTSMKAARATVMAMSQGLTRGFQAQAERPAGCHGGDAGRGGRCGCGCGQKSSPLGLDPLMVPGKSADWHARGGHAWKCSERAGICILLTYRFGLAALGFMDSPGGAAGAVLGRSPADEGDGERDGLHGDDEGGAGRPLAEGPEGAGNDAGGGSADVIAGHVESGGGNARAGRSGDAEMALRGGLGDEDAAESRVRPRMTTESEGARVSRTPAMEQADGSGDAGAQADAGDEESGGGSDDEADEVDEEERAERGGGEPEGRGAEVEGDPGEDADQGEEDVEADGEGGDEPAAAKERLHLVEE